MKIAIDDFVTGYSSLTTLSSLPIDGTPSPKFSCWSFLSVTGPESYSLPDVDNQW